MFYEEMLETKDNNYPFFYSCSTLFSFDETQPLHWHEELEILYCCEGEGTVICESESLKLSPGRIIAVNPNELHTLLSEKGCKRHLMLVGQKLLSDLECKNIRFDHSFEDLEIAVIFEKIGELCAEMKPYYKQEVLSLTIKMLVLLCRRRACDNAQNAPEADVRHKLAQRIMSYIDRHFAEPIDINTVCAEIGYSKSYICHTFNEVTGSTISRQIMTRRLNKAESLLATGDYSVSQCAFMSGFHSLSYFSKIYKKASGHAPSVHKEKKRNSSI